MSKKDDDIDISEIRRKEREKLNYQLWQGNQSFWFGGRCITGKRPWKLGLTFATINACNVVSCQQSWVVRVY